MSAFIDKMRRRAGRYLEERFVDLVGGRHTGEGLAWL